MQNEINAIAHLPPETLALCERLAESAFFWGRFFIFFALVAAILLGVVAIVVGMLRKNDAQGQMKSYADPGTWLEALKGLLQAFAALPTWAAMYVAGLALFWVALEAPKRCLPPLGQGTTEPQKPATPAGGPIAANTVATNRTN